MWTGGVGELCRYFISMKLKLNSLALRLLSHFMKNSIMHASCKHWHTYSVYMHTILSSHSARNHPKRAAIDGRSSGGLVDVGSCKNVLHKFPQRTFVSQHRNSFSFLSFSFLFRARVHRIHTHTYIRSQEVASSVSSAHCSALHEYMNLYVCMAITMRSHQRMKEDDDDDDDAP